MTNPTHYIDLHNLDKTVHNRGLVILNGDMGGKRCQRRVKFRCNDLSDLKFFQKANILEFCWM
jgi:hypothetical protein